MFKHKHILVKISFLIGTITMICTIITFTIIAIVQPGKVSLYTMYSTLLGISTIGSVISIIAFGKERKVYSILGFIFNLIVVIYHILVIALLATSGM